MRWLMTAVIGMGILIVAGVAVLVLLLVQRMSSVSPSIASAGPAPSIASAGPAPSIASAGPAPSIASAGPAPSIASAGPAPSIASAGPAPSIASAGPAPSIASAGPAPSIASAGPAPAVTLDEPAGTRIVSASVVGDRMTVLLSGSGPDRVIVLDARSGQVVGRVGLAR